MIGLGSDNNIYWLRGANIFHESHFRLGQLTSSTWPSLGCYLISALGSTSSSAPLQVHIGRGDLPPNAFILYWFHGYGSGACSRSKHQEVILRIHQLKVYSIIIKTAVIWTRTRNFNYIASKIPLQVASGPHPMRRAWSLSRNENLFPMSSSEWSIQRCLHSCASFTFVWNAHVKNFP